MDPNALTAAVVDLLRHPTSAGAIMLVALVVGGLVRITRTETINNWLANSSPTWIKRLPKWSFPWIALSIGFVLNLLNAKLNAHQSWPDALGAGLAGVMAGWIAIGGHESFGKVIGALIYKPVGPLTPPAPAPGAEIPPSLAARVEAASTPPPPVLVPPKAPPPPPPAA